MEGNDFMLSTMETSKSQVSVLRWFETEKPALIDHLVNYEEESERFQLSRRGINGSENFRKFSSFFFLIFLFLGYFPRKIKKHF